MDQIMAEYINREHYHGGLLKEEASLWWSAPMPQNEIRRRRDENGMKTVWVTVGQEKFEVNDALLPLLLLLPDQYFQSFCNDSAGSAKKPGTRTWYKTLGKTSLAPCSKVVPDYLEKAIYLMTWKPCSSIWLGMAAHPVLETPGHCHPILPKR